MIITDCNCGQKLACACTLSFSSFIANPVSVLDVGTLLGGSCTFDEYVIDWFRDGVYYMTSGVGNDPDIDTFHPFTGSGAVPVAGGNYTPVLRYVILTGQTTKLFSSKKNCQDWCTFAGVLPSIPVSSLNCASANISGDYQYSISYLSTQDFALASRKIVITIDSETKYLAFYFYAKTVCDQIDVFYKNDSVPLESWIVGYTLNSYQVTTKPYNYKSTSLYFVIPMPAYTEGDFYTIQITPSVLEVNYNTDWQLKFKCLTATDGNFQDECAQIDKSYREYDANTANLTWNAASCRYEIAMELINDPSFLFAQDRINYDYGLIKASIYNSAGYDWNLAGKEKRIYIKLSKSISASYLNLPNYQSNQCTPANGANNLAASGSVITLTYDNDIDYLEFKDRYDAAIAAGLKTGWVNDNTDINYYRFYQFNWWRTITQCGDNQSLASIKFFAESILTFTPNGGGGGTIVIDLATCTMGYVGEATCDSSASTLNNMVNTANNAITTALNVAGDTIVKSTAAGGGISYYIKVTSTTTNYGGYNLTGVEATMLCANLDGFCIGNYLKTDFYLFFLTATITAAVDANGDYTEPPEDNFQLYDQLDHDTGCRGASILIYEKVNGVQILPIP